MLHETLGVIRRRLELGRHIGRAPKRSRRRTWSLIDLPVEHHTVVRVASGVLIGDVAHREQLRLVGGMFWLGTRGRKRSGLNLWLCTSLVEMAILTMSGTVNSGHQPREPLRPLVPDFDPSGQIPWRGQALLRGVDRRRAACNGDR